MASILRLCIYDAARVRFMPRERIPDEVVCDPCKARIADNKASAAKAARAAKAKVKSGSKRSDSVRGVGRRATARRKR